MKKILSVCAVLLLLCGALFLATSKKDTIDPALTATQLDGTPLRFADLRGKPAIVVFWATTCSTCVQEMPEWIKLKASKAGQLEILAVAMGYDNKDDIRNFSKKMNINFPVIHDTDGKWSAAFGDIKVTPSVFVVDMEGRIARKNQGYWTYKS